MNPRILTVSVVCAAVVVTGAPTALAEPDNPCDFDGGATVEQCMDSPGMQEMLDYEDDMWGTAPEPEPALYYPDLVPSVVTYEERTDDGFVTVSVNL